MSSNDSQVEGWSAWLSSNIAKHPKLWIKMGNWETSFLEDELEDIAIQEPIFVAGIARSGTTILLEMIASHSDITTHQYQDFPPIFTPFCWNWFIKRAAKGTPEASERAHGDRIMITPQSPEAMEESLWMAFFDNLHDTGQSNILDRETDNAEFAQFYKEHMQKLMLARDGKRYASKGNYNITRLAYLHEMFPDGRFVVPVRDPVMHIASLMKQHRIFLKMHADDPKTLAHMQHVGHFEFGGDMRPIHVGDDAAMSVIQDLWARGEDVAAWAKYWAMVYGFVANQLENDQTLRTATQVISYEDLCDDPRSAINSMLGHCRIDDDGHITDQFAPTISAPDYYKHGFSDADLDIIASETKTAHDHILAHTRKS